MSEKSFYKNLLLAALPDAEWQRWQSQVELIEMPLGSVLWQPWEALDYAYFPTSSLVSLLHILDDGKTTEIAVIGNEGVAGIHLFMGSSATPTRAVVQGGGQGYRLGAQALKAALEEAGPAMRLFLRYTHALITQMAQTAACNRHHTVEQQLCRWIMSSLERIEGNTLLMTQELVSNMLGVRNEAVTDIVHELQRLGLVRYTQGHICVLDPSGLAQRTCECYTTVRRDYDQLIPTYNLPGPSWRVRDDDPEPAVDYDPAP